MANTFKTIIQDVSTGNFKTETGWDPAMNNAKRYDGVDYKTEVENLPTGSYNPIMILEKS